MSISSTRFSKTYHFLHDGGEMGELTRTYNWESTSLGAIDTWSQSLKSTVSMLLHSHHPMYLYWGSEMIQFYNDAFRQSMGDDGKHPNALGNQGKYTWPEIWDQIFPLLESVKQTGRSLFRENELTPIFRNGKLEDVYWTFSYSPIIGETGLIDGILVVCNETTKQMNYLYSLKEKDDRSSRLSQELRNIILHAPVAMCILKGPDYLVDIANELMLEIWGKEEEMVVGKPIFDGLNEAVNQGFEDILQKVYDTGETFSAHGVPVKLPRGEGIKTVYVHLVFQAHKDIHSNINGIFVVAVDVTVQVEASEKIQKAEQEIRSLINSAPFPIGVYLGRELRLHLLNDSIIEALGKGREIIGKTFFEALPELKDKGFFEQLDKVYTTGVPLHARNQKIELFFNGEIKPFYYNYSYTPLFDNNGKVYGIMNTAADVTDLYEAKQKVEISEKNFRNMILQSPVAMCILLGENHTVNIANKAALEFWEKTYEEVIQKPIFEVLPEARDQGLEHLLRNVYHKGETFTVNERPLTLKRNGQLKEIFQNFVYTPYMDLEREIIGVMVVGIEVTEQVLARRKIEEIVAERTQELEVANRDLKKSNADLAQFAYIASHDLQEPIRKIRTYSQLMGTRLENHPDEKTINFLEKIEKSSARMHTLIKDVLSYSEVSSKTALNQEVDLKDILEQTLGDFELLLEEKKAKVIADPLPKLVANPLQMSQLFGNLISNALKFSRSDLSPIIQITSKIITSDEARQHELHPELQYCQISFKDNGIGFKPEFSEQIFSIFKRLHNKTDYDGTGIGLALCKKIALNHHGELNAEGSHEGGAVFNVFLPMPSGS